MYSRLIMRIVRKLFFVVPFDQVTPVGLNIFNYALNGQFSQVYSTKSFGGWGGSVAVPQFINTFDPDDSRLTENYLMGQPSVSRWFQCVVRDRQQSGDSYEYCKCGSGG
mgnify:CR=1 FL=1